MRRADNHLAHFFFNPSGQWEQWDVSEQSNAWAQAHRSTPGEQGLLTPPLRKIERRLVGRGAETRAKEDASEYDWKYLMGH